MGYITKLVLLVLIVFASLETVNAQLLDRSEVRKIKRERAEQAEERDIQNFNNIAAIKDNQKQTNELLIEILKTIQEQNKKIDQLITSKDAETN